MANAALNAELLIKYRSSIHIGAFITPQELAALTGLQRGAIVDAACRYKWEVMTNGRGAIAYHADRGIHSPLEWLEAHKNSRTHRRTHLTWD